MFTRPYVPQSLCSPLYDISPYVSHVPQSLCYPEMFPVPLLPKLITQSLCSPVPMFPIFPSPYVSQPLCSPVPVLPVHLFPSPYRCSPVPMLPSPHVPQLIHQSVCSPFLFHKSVFHSLLWWAAPARLAGRSLKEEEPRSGPSAEDSLRPFTKCLVHAHPVHSDFRLSEPVDCYVNNQENGVIISYIKDEIKMVAIQKSVLYNNGR